MVISSGSVPFKVLFGAIATLGFVCLLLIATLQTGATKSTTTAVQATPSFKHEADIGREKLIYDPDLDLNYMMSKRKVPNGPDPIHNRKAGNSKRPPGRV
ncbi:hypothetical protein P3X46_003014 [Hevea brasiliensis]|uniref:Uncharacterized protein n=2 Tax=Hevea brasiliensis TaxID=3981 RepID=A0ABQ9N734_HEVBR|nr:CLAVATA3/ESR (CLE)-related protein 25 [Hevea brasiliensis]KAF2325399.1 hypothetical protein GH714_027454 [Hevea brasiliensis]KAJ9187573.1 hypothetical protein P3X46_003014 [Hevea brasiliensis]